MLTKEKYRYVLIVTAILLYISVQGQTVLYVKDKIKIKPETELFINGSMYNTDSAYIDNGGKITITDSIINKRINLFEPSTYGKLDNSRDSLNQFLIKLNIGKVIFLDDTLSSIKAYKSILFDTVIINNAAGVKYEKSDSSVFLGGIQFQQGLFDLNGKAVKLYFYGDGSRQARTSGVLINEGNTSRVVDSVGTGSVVMVKNLITGGSDSLTSLGIDTDFKLGSATKVIRYHVFDSMVTDGSIGKVFYIANAGNSGFDKNLWMHYIDSADLETGMLQDSLWIWYYAPVIDKYDTLYNSVRDMYFPSKGEDVVDVANDFVIGETTIKQGYKYTLAEFNCDSVPPVDLGPDFTLCSGKQMKLTPFRNTPADWKDYFYKWHSSNDTLIKTSKQTVFEPVIYADSAYTDSIFKIWVDVRDVRGCRSSDTVNVTFRGANKIGVRIYTTDTVPADFQLCPGEGFILRDTINKTPGENRHTWWFDSDTTAKHEYMVQHLIGEPGIHHFGVRYINDYGCVSEKTDKTIYVHPYPDVSFSLETPLCEGNRVDIVNNSTIQNLFNGTDGATNNILSYTWKIGATDSMVVNQNGISPSDIARYSSGAITTTNTNPDLNYLFNQPGLVDIILSAASNAGCVSSDTISYYVNLPAQADIDPSALTDVCRGMPSVFVPGDSCTNVATGGYNWKFGYSVPWVNTDSASYIFPTSGTHNVLLAVVSDSGCSDTATAAITIHPNTVAEFTFTNQCLDSTRAVIFTDNGSNGAESYYWDFGNGDTLIDANHYHSSQSYYNAAGNYNVTLVSNNQWGCADTAQHNITIYPLPVVAFDIDTNTCINVQESMFTNTSEAGLGFMWNFGDGTFSTGQNPDKKYSQPGIYNVILEGTSSFGCISEYDGQIQIYDVAGASFDPSGASVCQGTPSDFHSAVSGGSLSYLVWDFGDGQSAVTTPSGPDTLHKYAESGTYLASLVTVTSNFCMDTVIHSVLIYPNPEITIVSEGQLCTGEEIVFSITGGNIGEITNYTWNYGDLSMPGTTPTVSHFYSNSGNYLLTVAVGSHQGCFGYDTLDLAIGALPSIPFGETSSTCQTSLELIAGSPAFNYLWSNGSTDSSILVTVNGNYSVTKINPVNGCRNSGNTYVELSSEVRPGLGTDFSQCDIAMLDAHNPGAQYYAWSTGETTRIINITQSGTYTVEVRDINGCVGYDTITVTVNPSPVIGFPAYIQSCMGQTLIIDPGVSAGTFTWSTGAVTPTIETTESGTYWLNVTDVNGCYDNAIASVTFNPRPIVFLGNDRVVCADRTITLNAGNSGSTYLWSSGDIAQAISPAISGEYYVDVTNRYGCSASDTVNIQINPLPVIDLGSSQSLCEGSVLTLDAGAAQSYYWSTYETTPTINVTNAGYYWVRVTDNNNCVAVSDAVEVTFRAAPASPFNNAVASECKFALLDAGPATTYLWSDGNTGRTIMVNESGIYWVSITNSVNCTTTDTIDLTIKPMADVDLPLTMVICSRGNDFLDAGYFGADYSYKWNTGSTEQYIRVESPGIYKVAVTHADGCVNTDSTIVTTKPSPEVDLGSDMLLCANSGLALDAGTPGSLYSWGSTNGFTYSQQVLPLSDTGTYWVYVMAPNGCTGSDTVNILYTGMSIQPLFMCASNIRIGDTVRFVDLSVPEPFGYLWNFGDLSTSSEKEPLHMYFMEETYNVSLTVTNDICSASIIKPVIVAGYNPEYLEKLAKENQKDLTGLIRLLNTKVYPNPASDYVNLSIEISEKSDLALYLFSMNGQLLQMKKFDDIDQLDYTLDISSYYKGMYFLRIATRNEAKVFKILKIR